MPVYTFTARDLDRVRSIVVALCDRHERADLIDDVFGAATFIIWFNTIGRPSASFIWRCVWHRLIDTMRAERTRARYEAPHSIVGHTFTFDVVDYEQRRAFNAVARAVPREVRTAMLADRGGRVAIARREGVTPSIVTRRAQRGERQICAELQRKTWSVTQISHQGAA